MAYNFGETIDRIRKQKGIDIKNLIEEIMTTSTYHRFRNGEIETSVVKFDQLLTRLNVKYDEFIFIHHDYQSDDLIKTLLLIEKLYNQRQTDKLTALKQDVEKAHWVNKLAQQHVASLIALLTEYTTYGKDDWKNNELIQYLGKVETWTHYEVSMFGNSIKGLPTKIVDLYLNNVIHSYEAYKESNEYQHRICRILINAIISFLSRKEILLARKWYRHLVFQEVNDHFLFEKYFQQLLGHYLDFAEGNKHAKERFPKFVESARLLHSNQLADTTSVMNQWMIENYN